MPANTPQKHYLVGGLVLCAFPATVLLAMQLNGVRLPMPWPIFFGLLFVHGVRAVMVGMFGFDLEGTISWVVDAVATAGFAVVCFWIAWVERGGWSGGVPFLPDGWNQNVARGMFAGGGLFCIVAALRCLLKAYRVYRKVPDGGMGHGDGIVHNDGMGRI